VVSLATGPTVEDELAVWQQRVGERQVVLAVERLHASSGLLEQLTALERLLEREAGIADRVASGTASELPMLATCNPFAPEEVARAIAGALATDDLDAQRTLAAAATRIRRHSLAAWWRHEIAVADNPKADLED
jgi:trehalose-6-phosphate synthase